MKSLMHQAKQHRRWKRRQIWSWDGDGWEREPIPARHFLGGGGGGGALSCFNSGSHLAWLCLVLSTPSGKHRTRCRRCQSASNPETKWCLQLMAAVRTVWMTAHMSFGFSLPQFPWCRRREQYCIAI